MAEHPPQFIPDTGFDASAQLHRLTDRRIRLSRAYEQRIEAGLPRTLSESDLREAAADGPIAVINVSTLRCDAIVIQQAGSQVIPLSELTYAEARSVALRYHECLLATQAAAEALAEASQAASEGGWQSNRRIVEASARLHEARREENRMLIEISEWLWQMVARPVLKQVASSAAPGASMPRLWWCPTGPLVGLPLHAAQTGSGVSVEGVLDHAISSYTPTITALLAARRSAVSRTLTADSGPLLLLSLSDTPGERLLPQVVAEAESILRRLPASRVTLLDNRSATRQRVRHALSAHRLVHFGCHAQQDLSDPSSGALVLYDGRLTVLDLGRSRFDGDFAYLSACKTATGGVALAEEAVSMAAAVHFAGFRRVIATLWSVQDVVAAEVADQVYDQMIADGQLVPHSAALALHRALVHLRTLNPAQPGRWSPFVHLGI
ncbi:CHAT domain-containing protein [Microbispora amethystogenes]|uniref:CHAT domain-containing protein n=1 Tax=Microbispora amethystogenes TaxID=1427754 RepID=A0ABQ4FES5_9ACTN|nr:CHAT domain-containing protein [Microbispora amethystogenes]GIH33243.1 hypothetical protein Mam01_34070 [Microbispora amethystogenes]